jgi:hypothetical protein
MTSRFKDIPPLLHEARLRGCCWNHHLTTLHLSFQCFRRNVDGTLIEDSTVDLKLGGVERIVACYSPTSVTVKPSEFEPGSRIALDDLEDWPNGAVEAHLAINSLQTRFDADTACIREALVGELDDHPGEVPLRVHLSFEPHNYGPHATTTSLFIDCDSLEPYTNGVPLDIETWERQYEAWWAGWREHWSAKSAEGPTESNSAIEDTIIPAGKSDPPDLSYRPPAARPFLLVPNNAPAELLKPIEDYHTGFHERDWLRVAAAHPHFDQTPDERATQLRDQFVGWDFGRWVYVRQIDGWWCEGDRACLVIRAIEHIKGDDESPARNQETVITYGLRKFRQSWVIATWSQGWPHFGSADKLQVAQTWRDGWNLAESLSSGNDVVNEG